MTGVGGEPSDRYWRGRRGNRTFDPKQFSHLSKFTNFDKMAVDPVGLQKVYFL